MKKLFKKFSLTLGVLSMFVFSAAASILSHPTIAHAKVMLEDVFKKFRINGGTEYSELNNTAALPDGDVSDLIIEIIQIILRISGILTFLALTVGGIMYIVSRGEGDGTTLEKAKKIMIYSAVGIIIIMSAFAIVYGLTAIKF